MSYHSLIILSFPKVRSTCTCSRTLLLSYPSGLSASFAAGPSPRLVRGTWCASRTSFVTSMRYCVCYGPWSCCPVQSTVRAVGSMSVCPVRSTIMLSDVCQNCPFRRSLSFALSPFICPFICPFFCPFVCPFPFLSFPIPPQTSAENF
jgi:hypothetical protein